jgi:ABC-2 type transport system ATP-binding protein
VQHTLRWILVNAIETHDLCKTYGHGRSSLLVVDRLNLSVPEGMVFGCLGPNGAGKTTTIRMLCGVLRPSSGTAMVAGEPLTRPDALKARIGYANQRASVYTDLSVEENLAFKARLFLSPRAVADAVSRTLERLKLTERRQSLAGELSGGWRQRLSIATAIVHQPRLVFLDEPTSGLDPVGRRELWDTIYDLALEGTTVFVTTHYMDEAERCHRLAMIASGKMLAEGRPETLRSSVPGRFFEVTAGDLSAALQAAKARSGVRDAWITGTHLRLSTSDQIEASDLEAIGSEVRRVPATLEDAFVSLSKEAPGDRA